MMIVNDNNNHLLPFFLVLSVLLISLAFTMGFSVSTANSLSFQHPSTTATSGARKRFLANIDSMKRYLQPESRNDFSSSTTILAPTKKKGNMNKNENPLETCLNHFYHQEKQPQDDDAMPTVPTQVVLFLDFNFLFGFQIRQIVFPK